MSKQPEKPTDEGAATAPPPASAGDAHRRPTPQGVERPTMPTLTDPAELEDARVRSIPTKPAPRRDSPMTTPRTAPPGLPPLVMPDVRIQSNVPAANAVTRPAPPGDVVWQRLVLDEPGHEGAPVGSAPDQDEEAPPSTKNASELANRLAEASAEPLATPTEKDMRDRLSLGDYTGALAVAERLLAGDPTHREAQAAVETCRDVLRKMYTARIGPLDRVAVVAVTRDQMRWLSIDHRAGFVLSLVDGVSTVEMILDVSGMPELDALRILSELVQQRIIALE